MPFCGYNCLKFNFAAKLHNFFDKTKYYFPMQNLENMELSTSPVVTSPVMLPM